MVDTFTPLDRFRLPEVGAKEDLWAPPVSAGLNDGVADLLDEALGTDISVDLSAGDVTLSPVNGAPDNARPLSLTAFNISGTVRNLIVPDPQTSKLYFIRSSSTVDTIFKTVSGVGVTIRSGESRFVYVDAANDETEIIDFVGPNVSLMMPSSLSKSVLCDIEFASAGDTQVTVAYYAQGKVVHVRIPTFSSTITPGGNWNRVRLTPATETFVGLTDSTIPHNESIYALVNGVSEPFNASFPRSTQDFIQIMNSDSAFLANNDVLAMPHVIHATYVMDNLNG